MCLWIFRQAVACRYTNQWAISWNMSIEIFLLQLSDKVDFSYYADAWLGLGATKKKKQKLQVHIYVHNTQILQRILYFGVDFCEKCSNAALPRTISTHSLVFENKNSLCCAIILQYFSQRFCFC